MKPIIALALLAVLGFAAAGCGSGQKGGGGGEATLAYIGSTPATIRVTGSTALIPNVKAGTRIACEGMPGIRATAPTTGAVVTAHHRGRTLRIKRLPHGLIRVYCTSTQ